MLLLLLMATCSLSAQTELIETVRGKVESANPDSEVFQATIYVKNSDPAIGTVTNDNNEFSMSVPVGRQTLVVSCMGFQSKEVDVLVNTGREVVLSIILEPSSIELGDVEVVARLDKSKPINNLSFSGARSFSTEETFRFAGSLGDPARMVRSFAGVIPVNDSRNDIVVRGNSPIGVQYIMDGIEIANPNHFNAGVGMTGGQVTLLNTNLLTNSDFHLSAWPAPYGNALAGIFDLTMRRGNNKKREFWGQMGFNGIEAGSEGYFTKSSTSSYLISYRYSIPDLMHKMGVYKGIVPRYQDLTFKTDFDLNDKHQLSVLGLWGQSNIKFNMQDVDEKQIDYNKDELSFDERVEVNSIAYILGTTHTAKFSPKTELKTTLSFVRNDTRMPVDTLSLLEPNADWKIVWHENAIENKYSAYTHLTHRFSYHSRIIGGLKYDFYDVRYLEKTGDEDFPDGVRTVTDENGTMSLLRGYTQYQHNLSPKLAVTGGLFGMYFGLNGSKALEPRGGIRYTPAEGHALALAGGLYSQMQPRTFYFIQTHTPQGIVYSNKDLDFSRSAQVNASYDWIFAPNWHAKVEGYFQHLYSIPVKNDPNEYFTMLEAGGAGENAIIRQENLVNKGTGRNYGVEFTLEKFFSKNYYMLFNTTLYRSTYTNGFDKKHWSTLFDGKYLVNLAAGYELPLKKGWTLFADLKGSLAGGTRYTPVLVEESKQKNKIVLDLSRINTLKVDDYFRMDLRFGYRKNHRRYTDEFAVDLQNFTNQRNIHGIYYNLNKGKYEEMRLQAFLPMVTYRVSFSLK